MSRGAQPPQEVSRHAGQHDENSNSRCRGREPCKWMYLRKFITIVTPDAPIEVFRRMVAGSLAFVDCCFDALSLFRRRKCADREGSNAPCRREFEEAVERNIYAKRPEEDC